MITLWHNPRCSKSRQALALLQDRGVSPKVRLYLEDPPNRAEIEAVREAMGHPPVIEMIRPSEAVFKELGLSKSDPGDVLLEAMAHQPKLIERPVAILGHKAVIGRPPEQVLTLL